MFTDPHLAALAAVDRRGSFEAAAASLGVTPSAISLRIKTLEDRVGCLLIRRGQPARATETGQRLIRHHDQVALLEQALAADLPGAATGTATLRLAVNADSLATWVIEALAATDGLLFDLVIDDQDHSQDWLRRGDVAGAITGHAGPLQGCETVPLGSLRYRATASPGFHARHFAEGVTAQTLTRAPSLNFSNKDRLQDAWAAQITGQALILPAHRIGSTQGFVDAALAGLGWGMNPERLVAAPLAAGRLVELVADRPLDVPLFWQFSRLAAPAMAPLTRAIRAAAARHLLG
jgi:LysR family transcriptional regulator (chromosome initiation inhibitor)